jgi:hypothetical protein
MIQLKVQSSFGEIPDDLFTFAVVNLLVCPGLAGRPTPLLFDPTRNQYGTAPPPWDKAVVKCRLLYEFF